MIRDKAHFLPIKNVDSCCKCCNRRRIYVTNPHLGVDRGGRRGIDISWWNKPQYLGHKSAYTIPYLYIPYDRIIIRYSDKYHDLKYGIDKKSRLSVSSALLTHNWCALWAKGPSNVWARYQDLGLITVIQMRHCPSYMLGIFTTDSTSYIQNNS